jgi:hypothetical protein
MTRRIEVPPKFAEMLRDAPEAGMGYQIATVETTAHEMFERVVIDSGWVVEVPGYAGIPFTSEQISKIKVTNDKSRYNRKPKS